MTHMLLFLCSGNYYRSRYAEYYFNHLAGQARLDWHAISRGLTVENGPYNPGPMALRAIQRLRERGVFVDVSPRYPLQVQREDFALAERIVALKKDEHRPMLTDHYPEWVDRVEYWDIDDIVPNPQYDPMEEIERKINDLIDNLTSLK